MNGAVIALTAQGGTLALEIGAKTGFTVYLPEGHCPPECPALCYRSLRETFMECFTTKRALVLVMATGIAVRLLAPLIRSKLSDPAVVVMDERGQYAVSLLSGHWGGANDLAWQLGEAIGAIPVITTATDVNELQAVDVFAREYGLMPEPFSGIKQLNAAMLRGETVVVFTEEDVEQSPKGNLLFQPLADFSKLSRIYFYRAIITHQTIFTDAGENDVYLRPPVLYVGVGCRRGISAERILEAVTGVLSGYNLAPSSVAGLASIDKKSDEPGLLKAAETLRVPLFFYSADEINSLTVPYQTSNFVQKNMGVGAVCEPVAMLAASSDQLLVPKQNLNGITVAVAKGRFPWSAWGRERNGH
ncbi:MAG: cobalt-precorrin 5A hydrolase [Clostridiales bacterium]|jgi:cobalt-precorrin 5A hydrolase|nr:cobalt-precorrin 5A hydrolase [Clostridiales bacterium]